MRAASPVLALAQQESVKVLNSLGVNTASYPWTHAATTQLHSCSTLTRNPSPVTDDDGYAISTRAISYQNGSASGP